MSLVKNLDNIFDKDDIGRVRKAQEDSHDMALKTPNGDVFVVCDGMGGHVGGAKASSIAVESIINNLKEKKYDNPIDALNDSLQFANMQILGFANDHPEYKGMGTTACVLLLQSDGAYYAHVGDSRIYLYLGKEKKLHRITKDHSYVQSLVDKGLMSEDQAEKDPNKNRILKALGVTSNLEPTFNKAKPKNGDIFLICSDGLSGMIPDSTIEKVLGQNSTLEARGELLINLAMQGETVHPGGQDNCTVELIEIDNSPWPNSEFENYSPQSKGRKSKSSKKRLSLVFVIVALVLAISAVVGLSWTPLQIRGLDKKISQLQAECSKIDTVTSFNIMEKKSNDLKEAKNKIEQASNDEARKAAETGCKEKQKLYDDSENKHNEKVNSFKFKQSRLQELQEKKEKLQQRCIIYKNGKNESNNNRKK
jgi:protein phosphatase